MRKIGRTKNGWLELQFKLLEKQKVLLERETYVIKKKAIIFGVAEKNIRSTSEKNHHSNNRSF